MTREEIAKAARTVLTEAIDAFQELARETEAFADEQGVTVYLKHVRAVADSQLSKLHQDAGNGELVRQARDYIDGYHGRTDLRVGPLMLLHMVEQLADALERGSQVGDGWVLVPRTLSPQQLAEAMNLDGPLSRGQISADEFYVAMLAAAPAHGGGG